MHIRLITAIGLIHSTAVGIIYAPREAILLVLYELQKADNGEYIYEKGKVIRVLN
jgi:hypothetical protein